MLNQMTIDKQQIFLRAYESCKDAFNRYCTALAFGKMNAEDLSQDVLLSAYEHFDQIRNKDQLLHYLIRAARNKHISELRRKKFKPELLEQHSHYVYAGDATPEDLLDVQLVFQALDELPPAYADAVLLFEWMGFSVREIAEIQQSKEGAIKTRISRGRKRLRKTLEENTDRDAWALVFGMSTSQSLETPGNWGTRIRDFMLKLNTKPKLVKGVLSVKIVALILFATFLISTQTIIHKHENDPMVEPPVETSYLTSDISPSKAQTIRCTLKGEVIDRDSKELILAKVTEDLRNSGVIDIIPIQNGKFEYQLTSDFSEAYQLVFQEEHQRGAWKPIIFFPEEESVTFKLFPADEVEKNEIMGGDLNKAYQEIIQPINKMINKKSRPIYDQMRMLEKKGQLYTKEAQEILDQMKMARGMDRARLRYQLEDMQKRNHSDKTPEGKILGMKRDSLYREFLSERSNYMKNNPNPIAWLLLWQDTKRIKYSPIDIADARKNFYLLANSFPDHPYLEAIDQMLDGYELIKKGNKYVDFVAPDIDGNIVHLSQQIEGKVALLDLWASWCKPCIEESRKMVPIYEEFKDKGFTVVGVAREFKDTNALMFALAREKYPWLNLVELDDENQIWAKYNIAFSGGGTFLIDKDGTFLAIEPSPEEVRKVLKEIL